MKLCEGLQTIGPGAFYACRSLLHVEIPSTVTEICGSTFYDCIVLREVKLCESTQAIKIGMHAFKECRSLLRINNPSTVTEIGEDAFFYFALLRNVAISSNFTQEMFQELTSLDNIHCSLENLRGRFDELHIHRMCYYYPHQSMGTTTLEMLKEEVNKHVTTEMIRQDCLGMTPLHILLYSGKHVIDL